MAPKTFVSKYKDTLQVIYGTAMIVALYFGLSNKIELFVQKEAADVKLLQYQIDELKGNKSAESKRFYDNNQYAVMPKETEIKNN